MMVAVIFLIGPVLYMFLNFVIGPVVDKFVSECRLHLLFMSQSWCVYRVFQGHNRYFTLFGLLVGGSATMAMGILYASGIM